MYNEPDNGSRFTANETKDKIANALRLETFAWIREAGSTHPVHSGIWRCGSDQPNDFMKAQFENSHIINFHAYETLEVTKQRAEILKKYRHPSVCSEYMARPANDDEVKLIRSLTGKH